MSLFGGIDISPINNAAAGATIDVSNAMIHNATINDDQQKLKALFERDFDPDMISQYEFADIKLRFEQMLVNIGDLLFSFNDMECLALHNSAKGLQSVSRMFQEMLRLEFSTGAPMAQSTPGRRGLNQTMQQIFPGGAINNATYIAGSAPRNSTFNASGQVAAGGNSTFVTSRRSRSRTMPDIIVDTSSTVANADQELSNSAQILNQTVNQLRNPANMTYLTVPSPERHRTLIRQAPSQIPVFRRGNREN